MSEIEDLEALLQALSSNQRQGENRASSRPVSGGDTAKVEGSSREGHGEREGKEKRPSTGNSSEEQGKKPQRTSPVIDPQEVIGRPSTGDQRGNRGNPVGGDASRRVTGLTNSFGERNLEAVKKMLNELVKRSSEVSKYIVEGSARLTAEMRDKARKKIEAKALVSKVVQSFNSLILGIYKDFEDYHRIEPSNNYEKEVRLSIIKTHLILDIERRLWEILWMLRKDVRYPSIDGAIDVYFSLIPQLNMYMIKGIELGNEDEIRKFRDILFSAFTAQTHEDTPEEEYPKYNTLTFPMLGIQQEKNGELLSRNGLKDTWESKVTNWFINNKVSINEIRVCLEVYWFYLLQIYYVINIVKEQSNNLENAYKFADNLINSKGIYRILVELEQLEEELRTQK